MRVPNVGERIAALGLHLCSDFAGALHGDRMLRFCRSAVGFGRLRSQLCLNNLLDSNAALVCAAKSHWTCARNLAFWCRSCAIFAASAMVRSFSARSTLISSCVEVRLTQRTAYRFQFRRQLRGVHGTLHLCVQELG